jgi:hypothetical protein
MKRSIVTRVSALLFVLVAGCGPDPLLGAWSYTGTNVATVTSPAMTTLMAAPSGTLTVTASGGNHVYEFQDPMAMSTCTLNGTRSGDVVTFAANQSCMFMATGMALTATVTTGTATLMAGSPTKQLIHIEYSFIGTSSGIGYTGTGIEDLTATASTM